ncbi:unnamed protein product, partial [Polarella glacialis]
MDRGAEEDDSSDAAEPVPMPQPAGAGRVTLNFLRPLNALVARRRSLDSDADASAGEVLPTRRPRARRPTLEVAERNRSRPGVALASQAAAASIASRPPGAPPGARGSGQQTAARRRPVGTRTLATPGFLTVRGTVGAQRARSSSQGAQGRTASAQGRRPLSRGPAGPRTWAGKLPSEPCDENCFAFCLAESVDTKGLESSWLKSLRQRATAIAANAALMAASIAAGGSIPTTTSNVFREDVTVVRLDKELMLLKIGSKDCFVFGFGCLVCWGCWPSDVKAAKDALKPFLVKPVLPQDVVGDHLGISFKGGKSPEVPLSSRDPSTFERVALAYALAQSVKLEVLENRIDRYIVQTRSIPHELAKTGHVRLSSKKVNKMIGGICVLRNQVNLETDILDTPNVFWDYEDYEPLYQTCRQNLDVDRRVAVVNQRFEVLQDLFDVLEGELNERNESRLMWIIIWLCALEAAFSAIKLVLHGIIPLDFLGIYWRANPELDTNDLDTNVTVLGERTAGKHPPFL